jgi:NAD(P)-dependent dehydrogenase (short-subunit alcohol dehydrogenase family)
MGICDARVVIVTGAGAGRGTGREHALAFAEGAKVVVKAAGGDAMADGNDICSWEGPASSSSRRATPRVAAHRTRGQGSSVGARGGRASPGTTTGAPRQTGAGLLRLDRQS